MDLAYCVRVMSVGCTSGVNIFYYEQRGLLHVSTSCCGHVQGGAVWRICYIQHNQQTKHHNLRLDGVNIHTQLRANNSINIVYFIGDLKLIILKLYLTHQWAGIAQSVWRLATGWTVRGSSTSASEIFRTCPERPWGPPSFLHNGYRVFLGGSVDHPPHLASRLKKEWRYTSTPPLGVRDLL
jgi:hypothetical protein